jgi:peptidyl-prolyl cis-trans isomerase C/foldase protein PrsA
MRFAPALVAPLLLLALTACPDDPRDAAVPTAVATVGGEVIERPRFVTELSRSGIARIENLEDRERLAREVLERLVRQHLLFQEAKRTGVTVDANDVEREVRRDTAGYPPGMFHRVLHAEQLTLAQYKVRVERRLLVEKFLRQSLQELPAPDESAAKKRYEETVQGNQRPAAVRARQILVKTEEEATHALEEIKQKRLTVEEAARKLSEAPEKARGGDLGWFTRGQMPPVFDRCFEMEPGVVSDVVASDFGFHIFQVMEKRPARAETFDEAKQRISLELRREQQEGWVAALEKKLRESASVLIDDRALKAALEQLPDEPPAEDERGPDPMPQQMVAPVQGEAIEGAPRAKPLKRNR